jgi:lipoprotein-anchoring transpeptidase ErfK/SrfK
VADQASADAGAPSGDARATTAATDPAPTYQWAPPEPTKRKSRGGLWAGGIAVVAIGGLVAASLVLIAPGTAIAGVPVGGLTPGAAADAVNARLAQTEIVLTGAGGDAVVSGAELGAHVDAESLARAAHESSPMWNPGAWFAGAADADVTVDENAATAALRKAAPSLFKDAVDAAVGFDAATGTYVVTPAVAGTGIDVDAVANALHTAFAEGMAKADVPVTAVPVEATATTASAQTAADKLNAMVGTAGFYVGEERTVPVAPATLASWLTVSADEKGAFVVTADAAAIQTTVDTLADKVNRKVKNGTFIADNSGKKLKTLKKGVSGRTLGSTAGVAAAYAQQLAAGEAAFALSVTEEKPVMTAVQRSIEVDLSAQRVYLRENGEVVDSYRVSTGVAGHRTIPGTFRVVAKLASQNMGNPDTSKYPYYYTKNVPWVMYFNGDQALHGAYWHNNFGRVMSHGCVNLPVGKAKAMFEFASVGTPVWVHN